jgi:hypothetical protein
LLASLALGGLAAPSSSQTFAVGEIAGEITWEVPAGLSGAQDFVLRATMPVPPGYTTGARLPFRVLDHDGTPVTGTQIETVTRYADATDGADVIEIIAPVTKDPSLSGGSGGAFDTYAVQYVNSGLWPTRPTTPTIEDLIDGIGAANLPDSIESLIHGTGSNYYGIEIRCKDAKGNAFVAYPLNSIVRRLHRYGPSMVTLETYTVLMPLVPLLEDESYPHMMGVHAYFTTIRGEEALLVDLRFNNGAPDLDGVDDRLGKIYFNSIDLNVRQDANLWYGVQQYEDEAVFQSMAMPPETPGVVGSYFWSYPIVRSHVENEVQKAHMMPCVSQFHRRWVISPYENRVEARSILELGGLGFCTEGTNAAGKEYLSWWNADTARYFPQRNRLPNIDYVTPGGTPDYTGVGQMRSYLTARYANLRQRLESGDPIDLAPPPTYEEMGGAPRLGWAHPLGDLTNGVSGTNYIQFLEGERVLGAASRDGYRHLQLSHRMTMDRQATAMYKSDGDPVSQYDYLIKDAGCSFCPTDPDGDKAYSLFNFDMNFGFATHYPICSEAPSWDINSYVITNGLQPDYDVTSVAHENLNNYDAIDIQHLVRLTKNAKALAWIGNDHLAQGDILANAEIVRWVYSEFPSKPHMDEAGKQYYAVSLRWDQKWVEIHKGLGAHLIRHEGWVLDTMNAAYALEEQAWRDAALTWYERVIDMLVEAEAQLADPTYLDASGQPYAWSFLDAAVHDKLYGEDPPAPRGRSTWHEMIVQNALRGIDQSVLPAGHMDKATLQGILQRSLYGLLAPISWNESALSPHVFDKVPETEYHKGDLAQHTLHSPPLDQLTLTTYCCESMIPAGYPPSGDNTNVYWLSSMGIGLDLTGDLLFLHRPALQFQLGCGAPPVDCSSAVLAHLESLSPINPGSGAPPFHSWAALMALLQP